MIGRRRLGRGVRCESDFQRVGTAECRALVLALLNGSFRNEDSSIDASIICCHFVMLTYISRL